MSAFDIVSISDEVGRFLDPLHSATDQSASTARTLAARPGSLNDQTLAVIDNRTNPAFRARLIERLQASFAIEDVILAIKDTVNVPPRPEDWAEVTKRGTVGLALYGA
jgi:hypothetical protein